MMDDGLLLKFRRLGAEDPTRAIRIPNHDGMDVARFATPYWLPDDIVHVVRTITQERW